MYNMAMCHKIVAAILSLLFLSACATSKLSYFDITSRCQASEVQTIVIYKKQFVVYHYENCDNIMTVIYADEGGDRAKNELARVASYEAVSQFVNYHHSVTNKRFDYELLGSSTVVFTGPKRAFVNFFRLIEIDY